MVALSTQLDLEAWFKFKYHEEQQRFWNCQRRFQWLDCGRASGKTALAKRKLVKKHLWRNVFSANTHTRCKRPLYAYTAPTVAQAKRIAWDDFQSLIPSDWLLPGTKGVNKTDLCLTTEFGSRLFIVGMDHPERIEGDQYAGIIRDECSDQKPKSFERSILPALSTYRGWCWNLGVPKRQGPGAADFKRACKRHRTGKRDPDSISFTWASRDLIDPDIDLQARLALDSRDYAEQFNAEWQTSGGGAYHAFDENENCKPCEYYRDMLLYIGCDFNVCPMAWVLLHRHSDTWEVFDEIWKRDTNTPATLKTLYQKYRKHRGGFLFIGDAAARQRKTSAAMSDYEHIHKHEGFKRLGRKIDFPRAAPAIEDRLASTNAQFCNAAGQRRLFIDKKRAPNLFNDLDVRHFLEGTRTLADQGKPGDVGHAADGLDYVIHRVTPLAGPLILIPAGPVGMSSGR